MLDEDPSAEIKAPEGDALGDDATLLDIVKACRPQDIPSYLSRTSQGAAATAHYHAELTAVHDGLSVPMHAALTGSAATFKAVFDVMVANLSNIQLDDMFGGGVPRENLKLLLLVAEGDHTEVFDAVLGALDVVAAICYRGDSRIPSDDGTASETEGATVGRQPQGVPPGRDLTLLQAVYSGDPDAVAAWTIRTVSAQQRASELASWHAGRSPVMHAALVASAAVVADVFAAMRGVATPQKVVRDSLCNFPGKLTVVHCAARGGDVHVFKEVIRRVGREELSTLLARIHSFGRGVLIDAALNEGPNTFWAVSEILGQGFDEGEVLEMIRDESFDGAYYGVLHRPVTSTRCIVAARLAAMKNAVSGQKMANAATISLGIEIVNKEKIASHELSPASWLRRLTFLLACEANITTGIDGNLRLLLDTLGIEELTECFLNTICAADNPFIPGMMLAIATSRASTGGREDRKRKLADLYEVVVGLVLETFEQLPQTVAGFPGGAKACAHVFEPETTGARPASFVGPLKRAFRTRRHTATFCTQPLAMDFIGHTFGAGLPALHERVRAGKHAVGPEDDSVLSVVNPALITSAGPDRNLQWSEPTVLRSVQFVLVGLLARPNTYYRVPVLRMAVDLTVYLLLLVVYTYVVSDMYETTVFNPAEIALGFYVAAAVAAEMKEMKESRRDYFRDTWNWLDFPALFLLTAGFVTRVGDTLPGHDADRVGQALYLLSAPLLFARVLFFAQIIPQHGAMIQVMVRMVGILARFGLVMAVIMTGFVVSFWASRERFKDETDTDDEAFGLVWVSVFKAMLGDFDDIEYLNADPDWVDRVLFLFYLVVMTVMLLNLLIAVLSTAHANMETRAEVEIRASKVRTMEHYRRVVANDLLPAPFNLAQVVALLPFKVLDLLGWHEMYRRARKKIAKSMGHFVFWLASGPLAILLGFFLWTLSIPSMMRRRWLEGKPFWRRVYSCVAVIPRNIVLVPWALLSLWALGALGGVRRSSRPVGDHNNCSTEEKDGSLDPSSTSEGRAADAYLSPLTVNEILMRREKGVGVHQLRVRLGDPMGDPGIRRDEVNCPTTMQHVKLLRSRLEATSEERAKTVGNRLEQVLREEHARIETRIADALAHALDRQGKEMQKRFDEKLEHLLGRLGR